VAQPAPEADQVVQSIGTSTDLVPIVIRRNPSLVHP
jgi:hypothetical protein